MSSNTQPSDSGQSNQDPHQYSPQILFELFRKSAEDAEKRAKDFEKEMRERDKKREEEKAEAKKRAEEEKAEAKKRAEEEKAEAKKRAEEFEKEMREREKKREQEREEARKAEAKKRAEEEKRAKDFEKEMKERAEEFEKEMKEREAAAKKRDEEFEEKIRKDAEEFKREMKEREEEFNKEYKKLSGLVGGIGNNIGKVAEELFYRSLQEKLCIGEVQYDDIGQNWRKCRNGIQEEYDILLTNGKALAVVEVKHIAYMNDLDKLERKTENFKKLFPVYQDFDIHPVIAGMSFESGVIQEAKKRGINVLVAKGDHIEEK